MSVYDFFGGPGGWSEALARLGIASIGVEIDADACATRSAAGHTTIRADVMRSPLRIAKLDGFTASPPCPAFSQAGSKGGMALVPEIVGILSEDPGHDDWPSIADRINAAADELDNVEAAQMTLEPFRWADEHRPEWVALEQVPYVLPIWEAGGEYLRRRGYSTWAGVLNAADFGVPQRRRRAIFMASRVRSVQPPEPTHADDPQPSLFGNQLQPWITIRQALGGVESNTGMNWQAGGTRDDAQKATGDDTAPTVSTRSGRQWHLGFDRTAGEDPADGPASRGCPDEDATDAATASEARSAQWALRNGDPRAQRTQYNDIDGIAPTMAFGHAVADWQWVDQSATTIQCDSRLWPPGHRINNDDIDRLGEEEARRRYGDRAGTDAVRLTVEQAAILQSFPHDYPWQGHKTSRFAQIGNAVPPLLAQHILDALINGGT